MDYNRNLSESLAVVGVIAPSAQAAGELLTGAINTALHRRVLFIVQAGTPGSSGTIDFIVKASTTSGGTYAEISATAHSTAITQLTAAGRALVEIKSESLAALGVGPYIKGSCTVGTATSPTSVVALGSCDRYEPAADANIAGTATAIVY